MSEKPNSLAERISKMDMMKFRSNLKPKKRALEISDSPELKELESDYKVLEKYQAHTAGLRCLDKILRITPGNPSVLYNKGIIFMSLKKWDRALRCFDEKIISIDNNVNTWLNRGVCLCSLATSYEGPLLKELTDDDYRRYNSKEMNDEEEIRFDEKMNDAMQEEFDYRKEHFEKGIESFQKAIDLDPKNASAWAGMGMALMAADAPVKGVPDNFEGAMRCIDRAIDLDPKNFDVMKQKAVYLCKFGDNKTAIDFCDKMIEVFPDNYTPYVLKGIVLTNSGNIDEGEECYDKAEELGWTLNELDAFY